jgi:hypothetical protein
VLRTASAVWDYSTENIAFLLDRGFDTPSLLPLGHHPKLQRIEQRLEERKNVDVLFYGSLNERRKAVLERLARRCRVQPLFGVYGAERDAWIARSRVVLNVHFYQAQILEQVRLSYLLSNGCFVVTERSPDAMAEAAVSARYDELPETCLRYLNDANARRDEAARGLLWMQQRPMAQLLQGVLDGGAARETVAACSRCVAAEESPS